MATINRVTSLDRVRGIRNKECYELVWARYDNDSDHIDMGRIAYRWLDRKAIRKQIAEWIEQMQVGDDIDLYVIFSEYDYEQLMTLTKQEQGVMVIEDGKPGLHWEEYKR